MPDRCRHGEDEDRGAGGTGGSARRGIYISSGGGIAEIWAFLVAPPLAGDIHATRSPLLRRLTSRQGRSRGRPEPCRNGAACRSATFKRMCKPTGPRRSGVCCWLTPSTVISNRKICGPPCACCAPPATAGACHPGERPARGVLRPDLPGRRHGGQSARQRSARTMRALPGDMPVLGLEPSCLFSLSVTNFVRCCPAPRPMRWPDGRCCCRSSWRSEKAGAGDAGGSRGPRECQRALPSEIVWRVSRRSGHVSTRAAA